MNGVPACSLMLACPRSSMKLIQNHGLRPCAGRVGLISHARYRPTHRRFADMRSREKFGMPLLHLRAPRARTHVRCAPLKRCNRWCGPEKTQINHPKWLTTFEIEGGGHTRKSQVRRCYIFSQRW